MPYGVSSAFGCNGQGPWDTRALSSPFGRTSFRSVTPGRDRSPINVVILAVNANPLIHRTRREV